MIIGTAGHIDHGKTALVRALTGVDTDRLKEEKARGISIDLGFAYLPAPDGAMLGFVDVPGHEKFVHNMLAGATGIDFVLLVVAADDGVMPQTREHLAIVDLLGIERGIVALTKADLVAAERRAEVAAEIAQRAAPTPASPAPRSCRSRPSPAKGSTRCASACSRRPRTLGARAATGRFRLAVDRSFTLPGAGTVVTGTVLSGRGRGRRPRDGQPVRARGARALDPRAEPRRPSAATAGERCALNLAGDGISKDAIARGDVVLDPELHAPTDRIDATLRVLASEPKPIGAMDAGAAASRRGRCRRARRAARRRADRARRARRCVQLVLERRSRPRRGDRFVLRDTTAQRTIGGGTLPRSARARAQAPHAGAAGAARRPCASPIREQALAALLDAPPFYVDLAAFARDRALARERDRRDAPSGSASIAHAARRARARAVAGDAGCGSSAASLATLEAFHADNPDLPGIGLERLRLQLEPRLPAPAFLRDAAGARRSARRSRSTAPGCGCRATRCGSRRADEKLWARSRRCSAAPSASVRRACATSPTCSACREADVRRLLKLLGRMGKVDEVAHDHFFLRETVAEMVEIAADVAAAAPRRPVHRRAVPRPARQRPQGRDPDPRILRSPRRDLAARRSAPHQPASARSVPPPRRRAVDSRALEEKRPRWGVRTSNPGGAASRSLVGSTPTLFRHPPGARDDASCLVSRYAQAGGGPRRGGGRTTSAASAGSFEAWFATGSHRSRPG